MPYTVEYFNQRVLDEIELWPVGILADYARLIELLSELGLPAAPSSSCIPL